MDREWRITYVNQAAERMLQRPRESLLGRNMWEAYPEAVGTEFEHAYRQAMETHRPAALKNTTAAGKLWMEVNASPSEQGLAIYFRDVTEQHRAREATEESEERFRAVFEQAPVGICQVSSEGRFERANPRLCAMFGYTEEELRSLRFSDLTHPDDLPASQELTEEIPAGQRDFPGVEKRYLCKRGEVIWARSTVTLLRGRDDQPRTLIAVVEDITRRKQAEETLRFQSHILDSIGEAVIATDPAGVVTYFNRFAETLYGWPAAEAIGRNIMEVTVPLISQSKAVAIMETLQAGGTWSGEFLVRRRDGTTFPALVTNTATTVGNGAFAAIIGISIDLTERQRGEEERRLMTEQLRALTARMESLREAERTRISREIHDELGQLLTGLKMELRWLEQQVDRIADEKLNPLLERIVSATELTDATLRSVQQIAGDLRPVVLDQLGLPTALEHEGRRFQERTGIVCEVRRSDALPALDPGAAITFFRIYQECLTNVARHSGATRVQVALEPQEETVCLCIEDNGRGMPPDRAEAGTSLGLLGMRERAGLRGGKLFLETPAGGGTLVKACLPLPSACESAENPHAPAHC